MHIYICDIYIYWFGGLDELTVANLRYRPYTCVLFFRIVFFFHSRRKIRKNDAF